MIESQIVARVLPSKCREAVKVLLQEVYGYEDFRNLEVYDDLFKGKEKLQLSQGQLIEEVIMEAEKGLSGNFWLVSFKISYLCLPLFYETRTTPSCHSFRMCL